MKPSVTLAQIAALRTEAAAAGDTKQVQMCDRALAGSNRARQGCAKVIIAAERELAYWDGRVSKS